MRNFKAEGIIIKRRNYNDADRILTVLTKTHGKIYIKASGVRKITSRRAGHIELLNHSILSLYKGNAFPVLTEATTLNNFSFIKKDLKNVGLAYHLCELVDGLCPENQESGQVFVLLKNTLERLSEETDTTLAVNEFEMQILTMLGYLPAGRQGWNRANFVSMVDIQSFIENILERKLKSRNIFAKLQ